MKRIKINILMMIIASFLLTGCYGKKAVESHIKEMANSNDIHIETNPNRRIANNAILLFYYHHLIYFSLLFVCISGYKGTKILRCKFIQFLTSLPDYPEKLIFNHKI